MNTDLNSLVMFAHVVKSNSFSQAARRLRMPISTVSRRVHRLAAVLNANLPGLVAAEIRVGASRLYSIYATTRGAY